MATTNIEEVILYPGGLDELNAALRYLQGEDARQYRIASIERVKSENYPLRSLEEYFKQYLKREGFDGVIRYKTNVADITISVSSNPSLLHYSEGIPINVREDKER